MMHKTRRWCVGPVASAEELARMLTESTWCLCPSFALRGYYFLNDATHEDGGQEYGVVKKEGPDGKPVQVESITMSWCTEQQALDYVLKAIAGEYDNVEFARTVDPKIDSLEEHGTCWFCA